MFYAAVLLGGLGQREEALAAIEEASRSAGLRPGPSDTFLCLPRS